MGEPAIDLSPLDSEGLRADRPSYARKWSTLTNVIFRDGRLRPRPGLRELWDWRDQNYPSVARGVPLAIAEIWNAGSTAGNRAGATHDSETLTPNGTTTVVAGWTGTHADIDETAPDSGTTKMLTSTAGAQAAIDFTNTSNSPDVIPGVVILVRARATVNAARAVMKFYWRRGGANYLVHTQDVPANLQIETDDWYTFAFEITRDPFDGVTKLTKTLVDSLQIVMEFTGGETFVYEVAYLFDADGNYTQWLDADDGGTASFGDILSTPAWAESNALDTNHGIKPGTTSGSKQSWSMPTLATTFASVTNLDFWIWGQAPSKSKRLRLFFRTGGTDYTIADFEIKVLTGTTSFFQKLVQSTTNPATSSAWTGAQVSNGEFGVQDLDTGTHSLGFKILGITPIVQGTVTGTGVEVDWMSARVLETSTAGAEGIPGKTRLWITDKFMARLDDDALQTITDVTNSVAMTEPPHVPIDWTILYGQLYAVNGDQATRRYPNGSNLFEALTTNNADGATAITGKTVTAFADRILYGWVKDNASVIPERVAFSKFQDGGTHNHVSAGDFDLLLTPGGVLKLLPLSEDLCIAYKQRGIYNLRRSGSDVAPIIPDLIDPFTELKAPRTVVAALTPTGTQIHLFLGTNPSSGLNVYAFDGSKVTPIGDGIQRFLQDEVNKDGMGNAFAVADPQEGLYYLFLPFGNDMFADGGFIYHLRSGAWTRFTTPWTVNAAGWWTIPALVENGSFYADTPAIDGPTRTMIGQLGGRLVTMDFNAAFDAEFPPSRTATDPEVFTSDGNNDTGESRKAFTATVETGDPRPSAHPGDQASSYRLHIVENCHAPVTISATASGDGGVTESTAVEGVIGSLSDTAAYTHSAIDLNGTYSHRPRVKLQLGAESAKSGENPLFEIAEMWLEVQPQGDDP